MRLPTLLFLLLLSTPTQALDVTHYDLELGLRADTEVLEGRAVLDLVLDDADAAAAHVELDFVGLEITSVLVQGLPTADWSRDGGLLSLPLPPGSVSGTQVRIEISYTGAPEPYVAPWGTWGVVRSQDRVFTVNVTEGARHWFPCHDRLDDKATVDLAVAVPDPWLVAAAGTLEEQVPLEGGRTRFRWSAAWPIPTYLIHFAAGPYMLTEEEHGGVPFFYWLHPTLYGDAADTFAHAPDALEMLTARYGPYPFPKVGFDEIDLGGAVEHPSCISLGTQLLTPTRSYEEVIAHELAHAWFQGVVTVASWDDVWLSEGMATYHEALYHEHVHGPGTLADYMESLAISYRTLAEMSEGQFPLSAPEVLFGVTTYRKGALVLHALSYLMGRDVFDVFLSDYLEAFAWSSASAQEFFQLAEAASGRDLSAFVAEWVDGIGYPRFGLAWRYDAGVLHLAVDQLQDPSWPVFLSVPLEVVAYDVDGVPHRETVTLTDRLTRADLSVPFEPASVSLDPDRWLLKTVEPMDFPPEPVEPAPDALSPADSFPDQAPSPDPPTARSGGCSSALSTAPPWPLLLLSLALFPLRSRRRSGI